MGGVQAPVDGMPLSEYSTSANLASSPRDAEIARGCRQWPRTNDGEVSQRRLEGSR